MDNKNKKTDKKRYGVCWFIENKCKKCENWEHYCQANGNTGDILACALIEIYIYLSNEVR
jgi:hypothetical protein